MTSCARATQNETIVFLKQKLAENAAARPARPGRAGGHRLPLAQRRAGPWLRHGPRLQSDPADDLRRRRPTPTTMSRSRSSGCSRRPSRPTSRRWPICSACAGSRPACPPSRSTQPEAGRPALGQADAPTPISTKTPTPCRACWLPGRAVGRRFRQNQRRGRHAGHRLPASRAVRPRRSARRSRSCNARPTSTAASAGGAEAGSAKILRYDNTLIDIEALAPAAGRLPGAQRRLAELAERLCRRPAGADPAGQCDVPRRGALARPASRALPLRALAGVWCSSAPKSCAPLSLGARNRPVDRAVALRDAGLSLLCPFCASCNNIVRARTGVVAP